MAKLERLAKWHFVAAHTIRQHAENRMAARTASTRALA
jgi:hypothetical protein